MIQSTKNQVVLRFQVLPVRTSSRALLVTGGKGERHLWVCGATRKHVSVGPGSCLLLVTERTPWSWLSAAPRTLGSRATTAFSGWPILLPNAAEAGKSFRPRKELALWRQTDERGFRATWGGHRRSLRLAFFVCQTEVVSCPLKSAGFLGLRGAQCAVALRLPASVRHGPSRC